MPRSMVESRPGCGGGSRQGCRAAPACAARAPRRASQKVAGLLRPRSGMIGGMPSADYVIVGAGSAGCALAGRLSEDPSTRVLLIEAGGPDRHPNIKIPAAFAKQFRTKLDWDLNTDPEPHCDGRSIYVPRGKG